jgi:omega-amidase
VTNPENKLTSDLLLSSFLTVPNSIASGSGLTTRFAIAQVSMHWTLEENLEAIKKAMRLASREGAAICAFSELAVTGFHRRIGELAKPELVNPAVDEIKELSAKLRIAAALEAPTFDNAGSKYITHHLINEDGCHVASISKRGLTDPEATFFARGSSRPVGVMQGLKCTAVICREVNDIDQVTRDVPKGAADVIFVPGALRQDPDKPPSDPPPYVNDIRALAVATGAHIIQTNWPNALNRPEESVDAGRSCVVSSDGELLFRLPKEASGVGIFNLGQRSFEWHPL